MESSNVNDLAKTSRVPRSKLYEVLLSLNRRGLVDILPETPQRFRANPLSALYDSRLEELRAEEAQLKRSIGDLSLEFRSPTREVKPEQERNALSLSHGRTQYRTVTRQLVERTKSSLVILGDKLFLARLRVYEDLVPALADLAARRSLRILLPANSVETVEGRRVVIDELQAVLRRSRIAMGDAAVWVRDREEYLQCRFVPNDLHPSQGSDRVIVGHDAEIANALHRLVEEAWESGRA